jgi:hypothetical protein
VRGAEALLDVIAGFHQALPGARLPLNSALEEYHQVGRFHWLLQQPDGSISHGTDFVAFNLLNQLVRVVGFFGPLARWQE